MKLIHYPPEQEGGYHEIRTEPEDRPGIGLVDVLRCKIPSQGDNDTFIPLLIRAIRMHSKFVQLLTAVRALKGTSAEVLALKLLAGETKTELDQS